MIPTSASNVADEIISRKSFRFFIIYSYGIIADKGG